MTLVGNRRGKFHCTNPSLETLATSFQAIQQTLQQAPPEWWKDKEQTDGSSSTTTPWTSINNGGNGPQNLENSAPSNLPALPNENITVRSDRHSPREESGEDSWTMGGISSFQQHEDDDESTDADDSSRNLLEDDE